MGSYVAFDVSLRSTSVHVVDETGQCLWRGKCATEPDVLAAVVRKRAPEVVRVGLETGFLSTWLCHSLAEAGLPVVCMDARQARAVLQVRPNKTDANDAEGLAQLLRTGFYREVRVKSWDAMLIRNLVAEHVPVGQGVALLGGPGTQGGELAVDGLEALLALGGDMA